MTSEMPPTIIESVFMSVSRWLLHFAMKLLVRARFSCTLQPSWTLAVAVDAVTLTVYYCWSCCCLCHPPPHHHHHHHHHQCNVTSYSSCMFVYCARCLAIVISVLNGSQCMFYVFVSILLLTVSECMFCIYGLPPHINCSRMMCTWKVVGTPKLVHN